MSEPHSFYPYIFSNILRNTHQTEKNICKIVKTNLESEILLVTAQVYAILPSDKTSRFTYNKLRTVYMIIYYFCVTKFRKTFVDIFGVRFHGYGLRIDDSLILP